MASSQQHRNEAFFNSNKPFKIIQFRIFSFSFSFTTSWHLIKIAIFLCFWLSHKIRLFVCLFGPYLLLDQYTGNYSQLKQFNGRETEQQATIKNYVKHNSRSQVIPFSTFCEFLGENTCSIKHKSDVAPRNQSQSTREWIELFLSVRFLPTKEWF